MSFETELRKLLNLYSMEHASGTPNWILARFMLSCLGAWNVAARQRDAWYELSAPRSMEAPVTDDPEHHAYRVPGR